MATESYLACAQCHQRSYSSRLFDTLLSFSRHVPKCQACGGNEELHLVFEFGLGAGRYDCKVLKVILPESLTSWQDDGKTVTFYPFLVILEYTGTTERGFWLPYWHVVEEGQTAKRKYGQWAPFMDSSLFESLLRQAHDDGYVP